MLRLGMCKTWAEAQLDLPGLGRLDFEFPELDQVLGDLPDLPSLDFDFPELDAVLPDLPGLDFNFAELDELLRIEPLGVKHDRSHAKKRGGRPLKLRPDADTLKTLRGLGRINATHVECARMLDVSRETFEKFLGREKKAREAFERGKALWRIELRRLQFKSAMAGSVPMLIWLGKQYLGQKDKIEQGFTYRTQTTFAAKA